MTRNGRVSLPDLTSDRPHPLGTAAVAVVALIAGLASAYGLRDGCASAPQASMPQRPAAGASAPAPQPAAVVAGELTTRERSQQPAPAGAAAEQPIAIAAPQAPALPALPALPAPQPSAKLEPAPAPAPATPQPTAIAAADQARFDRGYVAYLRCDGVPPIEGPFPCPRDLALERRVWRILSELERCPLAPQQRGAADIRVEFTRARGHAEWLVAGGGLDHDTVSRCVGSELSGVGTSLRPTRMVVSFRFTLY